MNGIKLNLGCGLDKRDGYINIDIREEVKPDLVIDLEKELLKRFNDESIEEIIAKDFIEHLSWRVVEDFLKDCYRVLKKGGRMYIQTPDLEAISKKIILNPNFKYGELEGYKAISYWVYGSGDYENPSFHKAGFTIPTLKELLEKIGFKIEDIKNDGGSNIIAWVIK
jgi:ubiquinone/menaquinone biosynthesis C-methylase UbiE